MTANKPETWTREYLLDLWKLQVKEIDRIAAVSAAQMVEIMKLKAALAAEREACAAICDAADHEDSILNGAAMSGAAGAAAARIRARTS